MIQGVIFDMDGVLADSEEFICQAAIAMFAEHGVTAKPEDFLRGRMKELPGSGDFVRRCRSRERMPHRESGSESTH